MIGRGECLLYYSKLGPKAPTRKIVAAVSCYVSFREMVLMCLASAYIYSGCWGFIFMLLGSE